MKGLLVKDLCLMATQKRFFILILGVGALLTFGGQDITFVMGYMMMVFGLFSGSTISYDDMNHGMGFLMTLPVSRKQYVRSKYLFMFLMIAVSLVVSVLYSFLGSTVGTVMPPQDMAGIAIVISAVMAMLVSVFMVLIFKFGAEQARVVIAVLAGIGFFVAWIFQFIGEKMDGKLLINLNIANLSSEVVVLGCVGIAALVILVTYIIAVKVMENKEF